MSTLATALAHEEKAPVWVLDFTTLGQRYVDSSAYTGLTTSADPFLAVRDAIEARLDLLSNRLDVDEIQVELVDQDGSVATFLTTNDQALRATPVELKLGFDQLAESEFLVYELFVDEWQRTGRGGFHLKLRSAITFLDRPIFEDFTGSGFSLQTSDNGFASVISMAGSAAGNNWRPAGKLLLVDTLTNEVELLTYSSFTESSQNVTDFTISQRRTFGVGKYGKAFSKDQSEVLQAWAFEDDVLGLFLRLATTTSAGTNGPEDAGDGDGLGDKVASTILERAEILALRREWLTDENGLARTVIGYGTEAVPSLLRWFEEELLFFGFRFSLTERYRVTVQQLVGLEDAPTIVTSDLEASSEVRMVRGWRQAENVVHWRYDFQPHRNAYVSVVEQSDPESQAYFGKSKIRRVSSRLARGAAGAVFGVPDGGWDKYAKERAGDYLTEFSDPSPPVDLQASLAKINTRVGTLVQAVVPALFDLAAGTLGSETARLFYVVGLRPDPRTGTMKLRVKIRRNIDNPIFVAADVAAKLRLNFTVAAPTESPPDGWEDLIYTNPAGLYPQTSRGVDSDLTIGWETTMPSLARDRDFEISQDETFDSLQFANVGVYRTFRVDVPAGMYRVTVCAGDPEYPNTSTIRIVRPTGAEAVLIDAEDTVAGQWITRSALVDCTSDTRITVGIGGATPDADASGLINWLLVEKVVELLYDNATAAEKQFWFASPDAGDFPDGGPAYDSGI